MLSACRSRALSPTFWIFLSALLWITPSPAVAESAFTEAFLEALHLTPEEVKKAGLEEAMQALIFRDYEKALKEAGPLAEKGNPTAITIVEMARSNLDHLRYEQERRTAIGPIDLRDYDGRYEWSEDDFESAHYAEARRLKKAGDDTAAFREWLALADAGDAPAQYVVYKLYERGVGVAKDEKKAQAYLQKSLDQGYIGALETESNNAWRSFRIGRPPHKLNNVATYTFYSASRTAANGGDIGYFVLSDFYCRMEGINRNPVLADIWLFMYAPDKEYFFNYMCNESVEFPASYYEAIKERAEAMSKAYDIPIRPPQPSIH